MRQFASLFLLSLFLLPTHGFAKNVYVNNIAGSDSNSGSSAENQGERVGPLRTIAAALRTTNRGDTVVLANTDVPYEECITLQGARNSGREYAPFVIDGNGATLDGTAAVLDNHWEFVRGDLHRFQPARGGHQMLFLNGEPAKEMPRMHGSYVSSHLEPKQWCRCQGGINFMSEKGKSPYSYDLRYAKHRVGITLYDVEKVVIKNLTVRGFKLDGINAHDNAMDCVLYDVTAIANGRSGIAVNGASRLKIVESQAHSNAIVQLRCDDWSTTELIRSELESETSPVWSRHTNSRGQGARLFVDDVRQYELQGWWTKKDAEQQQLKNSLDDLEAQQEFGLDLDSDDTPPSDKPAELEAATQPLDDNALLEETNNMIEEEEEADLFEDVGDEPATETTEDATEEDPFGDFGEDSADSESDDFGDMEDDDPFGDI